MSWLWPSLAFCVPPTPVVVVPEGTHSVPVQTPPVAKQSFMSSNVIDSSASVIAMTAQRRSTTRAALRQQGWAVMAEVAASNRCASSACAPQPGTHTLFTKERRGADPLVVQLGAPWDYVTVLHGPDSMHPGIMSRLAWAREVTTQKIPGP